MIFVQLMEPPPPRSLKSFSLSVATLLVLLCCRLGGEETAIRFHRVIPGGSLHAPMSSDPSGARRIAY